MFLKCIFEAFGGEAFFTVGGNTSKSGLIGIFFDLRPKYLLVDEIEHLKAEYQTIVDGNWDFNSNDALEGRTNTAKNIWVFATSNGTKKLEPLLSRFRANMNSHNFMKYLKKLLADGLDKKVAEEITISVWEQLPNPNIRNCVQIGRLVKNEPDIEMAIGDEIQNFKEYGVSQMTRSTEF
jgi:hypothetical protein